MYYLDFRVIEYCFPPGKGVGFQINNFCWKFVIGAGDSLTVQVSKQDFVVVFNRNFIFYEFQ